MITISNIIVKAKSQLDIDKIILETKKTLEEKSSEFNMTGQFQSEVSDELKLEIRQFTGTRGRPPRLTDLENFILGLVYPGYVPEKIPIKIVRNISENDVVHTQIVGGENSNPGMVLASSFVQPTPVLMPTVYHPVAPVQNAPKPAYVAQGSSQLLKLLQIAQNEKDVENAYRMELNRQFPDADLSSPFGGDGFLFANGISLFMEFKYSLNFKSDLDCAKVLIQVLYYLKKFETASQTMPMGIFIGDINECFVVPTSPLLKYLKEKLDWSIAPSMAASKNPQLILKMADDSAIHPYVFEVNEDFDFAVIKQKVKKLAESGEIKTDYVISSANIQTAFDYWRKNVVKDKEVGNDELVNTFLKVVAYPGETYLHPKKKNVLIVKDKEIKVNSGAFSAFFTHFKQEHTISEINQIFSNKDRLIDEGNRRRLGEFYTPSIWVDEAHKMIAEEFGEDWRDKYVVWDCSCYDEKTEVLTDSGWKYFKNILDKDLIFSLNPETKKGEYVNFVARQSHSVDENLISFKSTRIDLLVTKNHKMAWKYRKRTDRPNQSQEIQLCDAQNLEKKLLKGNQVTLPIAAKLDYKNIKDIDFNENQLKLIGFYLGDGFAWKNSKKETNAVGIRIQKNRKKEFLDKILKEENISHEIYFYDKEPGYSTYRIVNSFLIDFASKINGAFTKYIPKDLLFLPENKLLALFEGLMNSDGNAARKTYYTTSPQLAENFSQLCCHLGYSATTTKRNRKNPTSDLFCECYEIRFVKQDEKTLRKNNVQTIPYSGMVYDVTLEKNHILLVRRNGKTVFSGNCGIGNLTRDYKFKELYLSTIRQSDVDLIKGMEYNPGSTVFQFDFLNDGVEKLPEGLKKALEEKKPILFLNNPPYGDASDKSQGEVSSGISKTDISAKMLIDNMGQASEQLYCQFLYRMMLLSENNPNAKIGVFSNSNFLVTSYFKDFRNKLFQQFQFEAGMTFQASHFADVSGQWGIMFSVYKVGSQNAKEYLVKVADVTEDFPPRIIYPETKTLYSVDDKYKASDWLREETKSLRGQGEDAPQMTSAILWKEEGKGRQLDGWLGYLGNDSNNPYQNQQTMILSGAQSRNVGVSIFPNNLRKVVSMFSARKLTKTTWLNQKDEYLAPNTQHPDYEQWNNDAIVYSLFQSASQQSSLRQIDYKGKKWDIFNHFFFMSKDEMKALADENGWHEMYNDIVKHGDKERYVYEQLQTLTLSPDAQKVLDKARDLVRLSFKARMMVAADKPEYHLASWDAGWYQVRNGVLKEFFPEEYKEFVKLFHEFEDRMREGVYTFGFLRK